MSDDRHDDRIAELFAQAKDLSAEDQIRFLDKACRDDPAEVRREIEELLLADRQRDATTDVRTPPSDAGSRMIGHYKLLQRIGEGGMGEVWMADQQHPIRRRVALKLIKPGHNTKQVIARFEAERQALAMMDHQNIAKVLDADVTEDGQPYFVMELVPGIPFTQYCDQNRLTLEERLTLFVPVCQAVQHAHQKGIIHRDVKPSNVLVTLYDGKPVPKVIDFGLAKALQHQTQLTDKTLFTEFNQVVGTVQYMSPEQAEMNALNVDTRTDVYSLGVMLYELLAGSTPLDKETAKEQAIFKLLEIIREKEPPRPSDRLSASGDAITGISQQRRIEPDKLQRILRGELDSIVMKALEKDRARRYATADALAQDVERFLHNEPVTARLPTLGYRLRKIVRRNKLAFAAVGGVSAALVVGTIVSTWEAIIAGRARQEAKSAQLKAEDNFQKALAAVDEMLTQVGQESLANIPQMEPVRRALLEKALDFYQGFLQQDGQQSQVRRETALAKLRVSKIYYMLGEHARAERACRQAIAIFEQLEAEFPADATYRADAAKCYSHLGYLMNKRGDRVAATAAFRSELDRLEQLDREFPNEAKYRHALAINYHNLGVNSGYVDAAEILYRKAIELDQQLAAQFPEERDYRRTLAFDYRSLGELLASRGGRQIEGESCFREALKIWRKLVADAPNVPDYRHELALTLHRLGGALYQQSQQTEELLVEAIVLGEKLIEDFPTVWDYRWELTFALDDYGEMLKHCGRTDEAKTRFARAADVYRSTIQHRERVARENPNDQGHNRWLASANGRMLTLLRKAGRFDEAQQFEQKLEQMGLSTKNPAMLNEVAWSLVATVDRKPEDMHRAVELAKAAVDLAPGNGNYWNTLGVAHYRAGDWKTAITALNKSADLRKGGDSIDCFFLAMAEWQLGNKESAERWFEKACEWMDKNKPLNSELARFRAEAAEAIHRDTTPEAERKPASR